MNITPPVGFDRNVGKDWWAGVRDLADPKKHPEAYAETKKHPSKEKQKSIIEPVRNSEQLGRQLEKFGQDFISHDKPVRISFKRANYFMGTYSDGRIIISNKTIQVDDIAFNPLRELKAAWNNIAKGEKITWTQEYAIESFWHEILHNRQKGVTEKLSHRQNVMMETVNQWYSRRTYQKFMKSIGAEPSHQEYIKRHGLGYTRYLNNFDALLAKLGINENTALAKIQDLHAKQDCRKYTATLSEWLSAQNSVLSKSYARGVLSKLDLEEGEFEKYITVLVDKKD